MISAPVLSTPTLIHSFKGVAQNYVQGLLKLKQEAAVLINTKLRTLYIGDPDGRALT